MKLMRPTQIARIVTADGVASAVVSERTPARSYGMQFHTAFTEEQAKIAKTVKNGSTLRLFLVLPEHLDYVLFRRLDQRKLAADLDMTQPSISRALAELLAIGVVERQGSGPVVEWRLSPTFGWRGTVDQFHAEKRRRAAQKPAPAGASMRQDVAEDRISHPPQRTLRLLSPLINRNECENASSETTGAA